MYTEDELLPISALQHLVFCERQAALIHIEGLWAENVLTVEGHEMHDRAHEQEASNLGDIHTVRGLRIRSLRLGLIGVADVVEFRRVSSETEGSHLTANSSQVALQGLTGWWRPSIVEYKHGKPKIDHSDEVQLCAQAMCLEEALGVTIEESAFFYGRPRRRHTAILDSTLRQETEQVADKLHSLLAAGKTPAPLYSRKCRSCSLIELCLPKAVSSRGKVQRFLSKVIAETRESL